MLHEFSKLGSLSGFLTGAYKVSTGGFLQRVPLRPTVRLQASGLPIGPKVVPFWVSYVESHKVFPKRNYYGAYG